MKLQKLIQKLANAPKLWVQRVVSQGQCKMFGCKWEVTHDEYHKIRPIDGKWDDVGYAGCPVREMRFKCKCCGVSKIEKRWAIMEGSGALHYFHGGGNKPYTYYGLENLDE